MNTRERTSNGHATQPACRTPARTPRPSRVSVARRALRGPVQPGRGGGGLGGRAAPAGRLPRPAPARGERCSVFGVRAVFRPRFRREVRRFTSDLERGPDGAQGARTGAGGRGEAGARPPRVEPALQPRDQRSRLVAKVPDAVRVVHRCGFRVTVDYSLHRNTRIILSHSVAVRFALVGYCCARSSCSAGAQGASPRTAVRTAHALLAEWRAAFQGRPSLT